MQTATVNSSGSRACIPGYSEASIRFEWLVTLSSLWLLTGLFLDGWAHNNIPDLINTFFTPWHVVLYSGYAVTAIVLVTAYVGNLRKGYSWLHSLPHAYMVSLLGAAIFAVAGNLDFIWHSLFGFEAGVEALVSPSHLVLAVGGVMMISGPLRAAWMKSGSKDQLISWPALLSLFSVLGVFTFFTQFANAFSHPNILVGAAPAGDTYPWDVTIISYILIPTILFMGFILMTALRWKLPPGSLTFLLAGNSTLMFVMTLRYSHERWPVLVAAVVGGISADVLLAVLKPSKQRVKAFRWFGFLTPALLFLTYLLSLILTKGIWWNSNMWLGITFFSGVAGLFLSWLAVPPSTIEMSTDQ